MKVQTIAIFLLLFIALSPTVIAQRPEVLTMSATAVGTTGLTMNGTIHPHGLPTRYYFQYGTTRAYGRQTPVTPLPPRLAAYYREEFEHGNGGWSERVTRMPYFRRGGVKNSGYVRYVSPTSDDNNHVDGIGVLHLVSYIYTGPLSSNPELRPSLFLGGGDPDLRGARVSLSLRGRNWVANGSEVIWWSQSQSNLEMGTRPGYKRANWGYTGYFLTPHLKSGRWESVSYTLRHNSHFWSFGGYNVNIPGFDDIKTPQGRVRHTRYPYWSLNQTQAHVNYDFFHLLAFVNPKKPPQGAIDFDNLQLTYRNHSLLLPGNGGRLVASPPGSVASLTDGWRNGKGKVWQSQERPRRPLEFQWRFDKPVKLERIQIHQNPQWPAGEIECLASTDGKDFVKLFRAWMPERGVPNHNFAFLLKKVDAQASYFKLRVLSGYRARHWGLGEVEVFGSGSEMKTDNARYDVNTDLMQLKPGTTYHYRLVATSKAGTTIGAGQTFSLPSIPKPRAFTAGARLVGPTTAQVTGRVNSMGRRTKFYIEYGKTKTYGQKTKPQYCGRIMVPRTVFANLTSLQPNTTYHYRVVAQNDRGVAPGKDASFTTNHSP